MPKLGMAGAAVMLMPMQEVISTAVELGYEALEVYGEFPQCLCDQVTVDERRQARRMIEDAGLTVSIHAPFTSLNIATLNPGIRAESIRQITAAIDLCADIAGGWVTLHNGDFILPKNFREKISMLSQIQWDYNIESLKTISARAQEAGILLCLENLGFEPNSIDRSADDMLAVREAVGSPALFFCIDIGHARLNGELEGVISKMGPLTRLVHLTDNFGEVDDHLTIGAGNFDYSPCLEFIKNFDGPVILEVVKVGTDPEPARQSLAYVRSVLNL